ncbi:UvrD-helicase domain-containing protein [Pseudoxanthomonas wuyuanensis]|uniref:DNA 3'-5' helicase II n=1 Tax=Pseudoxanthomonas wuyuanensis TaxID=1073196 RepID=A0A286D801_9GAMM|nr:ATP-dependent helicase [Pseudoxanthomonas wuyuanensis]KAF1720151.1 ATP-dependent helicase [Pseudoxanthomonas wuyuanensis]SOD54786.1 Superfamily I DNA or RNA helicase [Pseudoxanthomonas wuyuanensis]
MTQASAEQLQIIGAPLTPMSVIACAGSGKTFTAVRRLAEIRRQLGNHRGRAALLSFSNVAVDTFRQEYQMLVQNASVGSGPSRVEIDTLDGFITANVLRPHAYRTMGARQAAFLVTGGESFLNGFKFNTDTYPREITKMQAGIDDGQFFFHYADNDNTRTLNTAYASGIINRLGQIGAYTHNLGRYWCHRTLAAQPAILRALARRYPHILIDEAQDIGTVHQAIIEQLVGAGCQVSLIGDPNQGIYEFAGANGSFLTRYGQRAGVSNLGLTRNYRSVPAIVDLANRLSIRADTADRCAPRTTHGAFFVSYRNADRENLITSFQAAVAAAELDPGRSAVLCRGRDMADRLAGNEGAPGQGTVKGLAQAAILRDRNKDYLGAFKLVTACILSLLADPPQGLVARLVQPARYPDDRPLRRLIWAFTRNADSGLPDSALTADTQWHPLLLERIRALLTTVERDHELAGVGNLGQKLARRGLPSAPLVTAADLTANDEPPRIRVDTVHQAKGESLDAVLYLANKEHAAALLAGVNTEVGRIGYVAVTRARNLLWLGVPANALEELRPTLLARGFQEAGVGAQGR